MDPSKIHNNPSEIHPRIHLKSIPNSKNLKSILNPSQLHQSISRFLRKFPTVFARDLQEACSEALRQGHVHYAPAAGLPGLRKALAQRAEEVPKGHGRWRCSKMEVPQIIQVVGPFSFTQGWLGDPEIFIPRWVGEFSRNLWVSLKMSGVSHGICWFIIFPAKKSHLMGLPHFQRNSFKLKTCCEEYSVSVDPERVVVCNGGMEAVLWLSKNIKRWQEDAAWAMRHEQVS
jgi:hypothetical protein